MHCEPKKAVTQNKFIVTLEVLKKMSQKTWRTFFQTSSKLSVKTSCKSEMNSQITNTLKYIGIRNACWRHMTYVILMNNIKNYGNVRKNHESVLSN